MFTAAGYQVLIRGFRLALSVEGLKPRTIENYVRDTERFAAAHKAQDPQAVTPADIRAYVLDLQTRRCVVANDIHQTYNEGCLPLGMTFSETR